MVNEKNCAERILCSKAMFEVIRVHVHRTAVRVDVNHPFTCGLGHCGETATDECGENYGLPRLQPERIESIADPLRPT